RRKGSSDDHAHLFASRDGVVWTEALIAMHDGLPKRWFKSGVISFSDGPQSSRQFYFSAEALTRLDGRSFRCVLTERAGHKDSKPYMAHTHRPGLPRAATRAPLRPE